jgi:hypothetical protein
MPISCGRNSGAEDAALPKSQAFSGNAIKPPISAGVTGTETQSFFGMLFPVPDSHTFFDARFSCRELKRIVRIALDRTMAAKMACKSAHQTNVFR